MTATVRVVGVILAGGQARRLGGRDKALIELAGETLLARAIRALSPQVDLLVLSSSAPAARYEAYRLPVLADFLPGFRGPLAGIHAVLSAFPGDIVLSVAVDLPFLPPDLLARLRAGWDQRRCRYAACADRHVLALLWPPGMGPALADYLLEPEGGSVAGWLTRHGEAVAFPPGDLDFNLNTAEDLARAEARLATPAK